MQYALFDGFERKFLLDALEFGVLKDWKENPVKELPDIDESTHPFHVCYGGYLLNPGVSDSDISRKIKIRQDSGWQLLMIPAWIVIQ